MMVLIFILSAIPGYEIPGFGFWDLTVKKGGHMFVYALLAVAYFRGLAKGKNATKFHFLIAVCLAILYAASDELHQSFTPGRTPSLKDVGFDAAGAILGLVLWRYIQAHRSNIQKNAAF